MENILKLYGAEVGECIELPFVGNVKTGFPSPADDFIESSIDLNKILIKHKDSTFFAKVKGDSMRDIGIDEGDLLVIDKLIQPQNHDIVVCFLEGAFTCKRLKKEEDRLWLIAENTSYAPIEITSSDQFLIWGVVLHSIKTFKK
ncbi:translesion error-prone DNA polymerase V autoproteolytic subunit [Myroides ceti]|uniref:Translesion error-prone DNA polymerase V autoproteolytic subunit n=1 Tax=Paenimyroides ceti TaxID=395087 RepID=A0ABT8CMX7_9FLAO|nr:translesion error-prone DNA polymerase V autoproteolytic subunit [Paenimyroides ceti]MDN3705793.1 translesion error-prone DNA polymerase V autoproteolytic subunit [Paenimyroides ceti]